MEKRGLGRGLSALISDSMDEQQGAQVREIPVTAIVANPFQPRTLFDPLKQEELVASIKEHGILQPILVRRVGHERYQLVAGERRFRAAQVAGLTVVPALVKEEKIGNSWRSQSSRTFNGKTLASWRQRAPIVG